MAGKTKRNRKFDRNRKRSNSMHLYRASNRKLANKLKKIKKHIKNNPNDKKAEVTLTHVQKDFKGPKVLFPQPKEEPKKFRAIYPHEVDMTLDKRDQYNLVVSFGVLVTITPFHSQAEAAFNALKCEGVWYKVTNNIREVYRTKRSLPLLSFKELTKRAYGELHK